MVTITSQEDLGREVVREGLLLPLRATLGVSRNTMAEYLYVSVTTYRSWESNKDTRITKAMATRLGSFYEATMNELKLLLDADIELSKLMPLHMAAINLGITQEMLTQRWRNNEFHGEDLGILGPWIYRDEVIG